MKKSSLLIILLLSIFKTATSQTDTIRIQTSAQCEMCKSTIENDLSFEKGIKKSDLNMESKIITVIYNPEKTSSEKIMKAITKSGYDADSLKADPKAYKRLPDCCKKH